MDAVTLAAANAAAKKKRSAANLLTRLAPSTQLAIPATTATVDTPTVSWSTSATVNGQVFGPQSGLVTEVGSRGTWSAPNARLQVSGASGLDFYLTGTTVEVFFFTNTVTVQPIWIWVNGAPVTATPDNSQAVPNTPTAYWVKLVFPTNARRRIEFFAPTISGWYGVRCDTSSLITPAPRKPVVGFVMDSFAGGNPATPLLQGQAFIMARMLGVECFSLSFGGTGYVAAGAFNTYGSAARVSAVAAGNPELIVLSGSVNDDSATPTQVQSAATAAFAAYAAACPQAKLIVFGPQPSSAAGTLATNRAANNAAMAAACAASPNVLAYHDMIGTAGGTVPPAFSTVTTYNDGALVSYIGSVWKLVNGGATSLGGGTSNTPGTAAKWVLQTYSYTGTGQVGTTVGDGTRDIYLSNDGLHPTVDGTAALSIAEANYIRSDLLAAAS